MNAQLKNFDSFSLPDLQDPTETMPETWVEETDFETNVDDYWDRELADELL